VRGFRPLSPTIGRFFNPRASFNPIGHAQKIPSELLSQSSGAPLSTAGLMRRHHAIMQFAYSRSNPKHCAMQRGQTTPSFKGLRPASLNASAVARVVSKKTNTRCELMLRRELWRQGLRFRLHQTELSGQPDIVFTKQRLAVFCDGDFWHSRNLSSQLAKLATGHNPVYWTAKIQKKC
jgi:DNA mismatch endonuclease Vsr